MKYSHDLVSEDCSGFFNDMRELMVSNGVTDNVVFASELLLGYEDTDEIMADFEYYWPTTRLTIMVNCHEPERRPQFEIKYSGYSDCGTGGKYTEKWGIHVLVKS